jgi:hypothetical protein
MSNDPNDNLNEYLEVLEDEESNGYKRKDDEIEFTEDITDITGVTDNIRREEKIIEEEEDDPVNQEDDNDLINSDVNNNVIETNEGNKENNGGDEITTTTHGYNLRPNQNLSYSHKYSFLSVHAGV